MSTEKKIWLAVIVINIYSAVIHNVCCLASKIAKYCVYNTCKATRYPQVNSQYLILNTPLLKEEIVKRMKVTATSKKVYHQ